MSTELIRIPPYHYIHVQDRNRNITRLEIGPQNYIKQDHEIVVTGKNPIQYVILPYLHYCVIDDPVMREKNNDLKYDKHGQVRVNLGESEIRTAFDYKDPFPLYFGEKLIKIEKLPVVSRDCAIKLEALRDFYDQEAEKKRVAGDEWLEFGPKIYIPRVEVKFSANQQKSVQLIEPITISSNQALKVKAIRTTTDYKDEERNAGEEWLIRDIGLYIPRIDEEIVKLVDGEIINEQTAILLQANQTFKDIYGKERKAGEYWLITNDISSTHIVDVYESLIQRVNMTVLKEDEYCYLLNPIDENGVNQLSKKILIKGPKSFFVQPGEEITGGIQKAFVLLEDEALLLRAEETHQEDDEVRRVAGDRWIVKGPCRYILPVEVILLEKLKSYPLDKVEGIYVRDTRNGSVRSVIGETYMLKAHEELWEMPLDETVEDLLGFKGLKRDKTKLVTFKCPFNSAVQVYDYTKKKTRIVFGPRLIKLEPDEQFTVLYLSGGKPKRPGVIKTIHVGLGPDFFTDIFHVETSDHARLELQLSYNWYFRFDPNAESENIKIFNVKDFVGDACSAIASKVRGEVASISFEQFHKNSAMVIRRSIFGLNEQGKVIDELLFPNNDLVVTNVDIQRVEPVDEKTKQQLQKSVTLAIEITTKMQEAMAKQNADKQEQEAKGALMKKKIEDDAKAEQEKKELYQLQAECESIKTCGTAKAEAKAKQQQKDIEGKAEVTLSQLKAKAKKITEEAEITYMKQKNTLELEKARSLKELEIGKAKNLAEIESGKFKQIVDSIGQDTLIAISKAGPEMQAELLGGLGLTGYLMMDANNPINLFTAANGMISGPSKHE